MKHGYLASLSLVALLGMGLAPLVQAKDKNEESWLALGKSDSGDIVSVKIDTFERAKNSEGLLVGKVLTSLKDNYGEGEVMIAQVSASVCKNRLGRIEFYDPKTKEFFTHTGFNMKFDTTGAVIAEYICERLKASAASAP